ncbi:hypothetical protein Dimus_028079 [Dionaea muscipula]
MDQYYSVSTRAEVDTRPPFRSVKEAVALFGERVLAGDLYSPARLKSIHNHAAAAGQPNPNGHGKGYCSKHGSSVTTTESELEEAKQSLQKAREETAIMADNISSLKEELERTRRELQELKQRESQTNKQIMMDFGVEDLKYVEELPKSHELLMIRADPDHHNHTNHDQFQKKRCVTFAVADPPPIAQVTAPAPTPTSGGCGGGDEILLLARHPSDLHKMNKKKKKKNAAIFMPSFGGLFSRKNNYHQAPFGRSP